MTTKGPLSTTVGPPRRASVWAEALPTLAIAMLLLLWIGESGYRESLVNLFTVYALLALGLYIPFIMGGALSLAYNAYLGIGALSVALIGTRTDLSMLLAIPIGVVIAVVVAVVLGLVTRGLSGFFLAAVTLLFGITFQRWLVTSPEITGGASGIGGIPDLTLFGWTVDRRAIVAAGVFILWALILAVSRARRAQFGIALRAQAEIRAAADASGVRTKALDIVALGIGAAIASVAGSQLALVNQFVQAESFSVHLVFLAIFMPLLGGRSTPWGVAVGAALVIQFTINLDLFEQAGSLMFGVAVLFVLLVAPEGILGYLGLAVRWVRDRLHLGGEGGQHG